MIRESSDLVNTSSDAELSDWKKDDMNFTNRMTTSKDTTDKRMINLYKLRRAETGISIEEIKKREKEEELALKLLQDSLIISEFSLDVEDDDV